MDCTMDRTFNGQIKQLTLHYSFAIVENRNSFHLPCSLLILVLGYPNGTMEGTLGTR